MIEKDSARTGQATRRQSKHDPRKQAAAHHAARQPGRANKQYTQTAWHGRLPRRAGRWGDLPAARGGEGGAPVGRNVEVTDGNSSTGERAPVGVRERTRERERRDNRSTQKCSQAPRWTSRRRMHRMHACSAKQWFEQMRRHDHHGTRALSSRTPRIVIALAWSRKSSQCATSMHQMVSGVAAESRSAVASVMARPGPPIVTVSPGPQPLPVPALWLSPSPWVLERAGRPAPGAGDRSATGVCGPK